MPTPRRPSRRLPAFVSRQVVTARRYFLDLRPNPTRPLTVVCGGEERVRADYAVCREDFPYFCIEFVAAGHGTLSLGGLTTPIGPGSVFTYGPSVPHDIRTDRRRRLWKYYADFVGRDAIHRLQAARLAPGNHVTVARPQEIREIFDLLQRCGLAHSTHSQALCTQLLGVLLTKLPEVVPPAAGADLEAFTTFEQFKQFLTDDRQRLTTVEQAAGEFGISAAYACRLFRRFADTSPYRFLLTQRITLAADLLTHDHLQVQQAAARLGFPEPSQFSRAFKRIAGVSPSTFQRRS